MKTIIFFSRITNKNVTLSRLTITIASYVTNTIFMAHFKEITFRRVTSARVAENMTRNMLKPGTIRT